MNWMQAGICLQIPSDELDNEACLLQVRATGDFLCLVQEAHCHKS